MTDRSYSKGYEVVRKDGEVVAMYKQKPEYMTLQQAKDEVAKRHGKESWDLWVLELGIRSDYMIPQEFQDEVAIEYAKAMVAEQRLLMETRLNMRNVPRPEFK